MTSEAVTHISSRDNALLKDLRRLTQDATAYRKQGRVWLERRPERGIWAGLYSLPVFETRDALMAWLQGAQARLQQEHPAMLHVLTHRDLYLYRVVATVAQPPAMPVPGGWYALAETAALGLAAPVRKLLQSGAA